MYTYRPCIHTEREGERAPGWESVRACRLACARVQHLEGHCGALRGAVRDGAGACVRDGIDADGNLVHAVLAQGVVVCRPLLGRVYKLREKKNREREKKQKKESSLRA